MGEQNLTKEQKIEMAKKLLWEVAEEERMERNKELQKLEKDNCKCGHQRKRHGKSHSINYTEGMCQDCKCKGFCME